MKPRYPNVAEQNYAVNDRIVRLTESFRNRTAQYPEALYRFLVGKGVDLSRSVLVSASIAEQGINPVAGVVLTQAGRFMSFDLDCSMDGSEVIEVHSWSDSTEEQNLNAHNPGFGKGVGCIAMEVLRRSELTSGCS